MGHKRYTPWTSCMLLCDHLLSFFFFSPEPLLSTVWWTKSNKYYKLNSTNIHNGLEERYKCTRGNSLLDCWEITGGDDSYTFMHKADFNFVYFKPTILSQTFRIPRWDFPCHFMHPRVQLATPAQRDIVFPAATIPHPGIEALSL